MIDFDLMFEQYLIAFYKENSEIYRIEDMEDMLPDVYEKWATSSSEQLGGIAPRMFFENITSASELIDILIGTSSDKQNPCSLLLDRIAEIKECGEGLTKIIIGNFSVKQKMIAINLMKEIDATHPLKEYINWLKDNEEHKSLKELAIEILCENANDSKENIFEVLEGSSDDVLKLTALEILIRADKDERTFNLLMEMFEKGVDRAVTAVYIGKYGDERSVATLYKALDTCNYMEYIEIKNAIERMGGIVEDTRDFSDDLYFDKIKNS